MSFSKPLWTLEGLQIKVTNPFQAKILAINRLCCGCVTNSGICWYHPLMRDQNVRNMQGRHYGQWPWKISMQPASMRNIIFLWHCTLILSFYCFHILHLFSCIIYFYRSQDTYWMEGNQSIQAKMLTKVSALNFDSLVAQLLWRRICDSTFIS